MKHRCEAIYAALDHGIDYIDACVSTEVKTYAKAGKDRRDGEGFRPKIPPVRFCRYYNPVCTRRTFNIRQCIASSKHGMDLLIVHVGGQHDSGAYRQSRIQIHAAALGRSKAISRPVDYYEALRTNRRADGETIHRADRITAERFHPDIPKSVDTGRFLLLRRAY